MEILCRAVFVPLAVVLLVLAFHDGARERVLNLRGIARLERRLTLSNKGYWVAFGLLLAVGAFVRGYRFLELPMGQNQDGSMAAVEALCLADNGTDQYGTSWPTYFEAWGYSQMSTLYSYLLIPFVRLFGLSKFTLRFPMLLMGLLTLPLMWDVARRIGGRGFALTALFLLALNPWHMVMSRWALEANMLPHVVLLATELLLIGTRISGIRLSELRDKDYHITAALRLIVLPLMLYVLLLPLHLDPAVWSTLYLLTAMPCGTLSAMQAELYGGDARFAARAIAYSTLLSLVTVPIVSMLL